jgi:hypothetical protein
VKSDALKRPFPLPLPRERYWLLDLLNDPDLSGFCSQLKELEKVGKELARKCTLRQDSRMDGLEANTAFDPAAKDRAPDEYRIFQQLAGAIRATLQRFASYPVVSFDPVAGQWYHKDSGTEEFPKEFQAIRYLLRLIEQNRMSFLRSCAQCNQWYIARRKRQRCCTSRCRVKLQSNKPYEKKKRASYMRTYRAKKKAREEAEDKSLNLRNKRRTT